MAVAKSVQVDISVSGDVESKRKLDALDAKAEELKKAFPEYKLKIDSAAASAKIQVFKTDFKAAMAAVTKPQDMQVLTGKALKSLAGIQAKADELKAKFPELELHINDRVAKAELDLFAAEAKAKLGGLDKEIAGAGSGGSGSRIGGGGGIGLAGAFGAVGLAGVAAGGLGILPAVAAAGLGIAAFGALAAPTLSKVHTALAKLSADTLAYDNALTKTAKNTALARIRQDWAGLTPGQAAAVKGIQGLEGEFGKLSAALAPLTLRVLNDGLKVANDLLPFLAPLAKTAGGAIDGLVKSFGKFTQTAGFKAFMAQMTSLSGPAITTIGKAFGTLAVAVGKFLLGVASPGGLSVFTGLVGGLSAALTGLGAGFAWIGKHVSPAVLHDVGIAILGVYGAVKLWSGAQAILNAELFANPIGIIVLALAAVAAGFTVAWKSSAPFRNAIKDIGVGFLQVGIIVEEAVRDITSVFLSLVGTIIHGAADAFGWVPGLGSKLRGAAVDFDKFKAGVSDNYNHMIANMQDWQNELNQSKATVATATASIVSNFKGQGTAALNGRADVLAYTDAIARNGSQSNQARSARANLIADLRASGLNAQQAQRLVGNLQGAINAMHGKTVSVGVHGFGTGGVNIVPTPSGLPSGNARFVTLARGGRIPGFGGGDVHPALLEGGETVVDKHKSRNLAGVFKAAGVPGYAAGGLVGSTNPGGMARLGDWAAGLAWSAAASIETAFAKAVVARDQAALNAKAAAALASAAAAGAVAGAGGGPVGADAAAAQNYARSRLGAYGWAVDQMLPLISLWNQESGWSRFAYNASSGATGIPQALPYTKMPRAAWLPSQGGQASAGAQIDWGLGYIKGRYGSPAGAWGHEVGFNWYDRGGLLKPGLTLALNTTRRPEMVTPASRGGGTGKLQIEWVGDSGGDELLKWIRKNVRIHGGGSVQHALGHR